MTELTSTMAQLPLIANFTAVFEAIDPTTGAAITGVKVKDPVVYGIDLSGTAGAGSGGLPAVAPLWLPEPLGGEEG